MQGCHKKLGNWVSKSKEGAFERTYWLLKVITVENQNNGVDEKIRKRQQGKRGG